MTQSKSACSLALVLALVAVGPAAAQQSPVQGIQIDPVTVRRGHGDNFLLTWGADDNLYSGWGDGFGFQGDVNQQIGTGFARISGGPTSFTGLDLPNPTNPLSNNRWYSYGTLVVDGVLHAFVSRMTVDGAGVAYFWSSRLVTCPDYATTAKQWLLPDGTPLASPYQTADANNMYFHHVSSPDPYNRPFALPTFLQCGKNYQDNTDGFVYIYAPNGATDTLMRQLVMARVPKAQIRNKAALQYFSGRNADGTATWSADAAARQAVHTFPAGWTAGNLRYSWIPQVVYNKALNLYVMAAAGTGRNGGGFGQSPSYLGMWTAPSPWGPFTQVHENSNWVVDTNGDGTPDPNSSRCYIPGFASKWTSADGRTMYMTYSNFGGNYWQGQNHALYQLNVQRVSLQVGQVPVNQLPAVSLTAPANNASFTAPATIQVAASASDLDGTVSKVEFFQGSTLIGTSTAPPYGAPWTNVPAGTYTLTAKATDNAGAATVSAPVTVRVNAPGNVAPSVALTSPPTGTTLTAPGSVTLRATASDPDGAVARVDFYQGSTLLGSDSTAPYEFNWSAIPVGSYSITARAFDNAGATTTSSAITITVTGSTPTPRSPYGGTPAAVPGMVQAENFDEGPAWSDTTATNDGGQYRNTGVDIEMTTDVGGGFNVGFMKAGEWMEYTVQVATAATYVLEARVASSGPGGTLHVEVGGADKTGPLAIPDTGGWQAWTTVTRTVTLAAGTQVLRISVDGVGASGFAGNLNHLRLTVASTPAPTAGTGLRGEYYDQVGFLALRKTRIDPGVNFDWGSGSPDPSIGPDGYSVRWTGQLEPRFTETHTFTTLSDDGARLWVDGRLVVDHWSDHGPSERSGTIALVAGRRVELKLEYYENGGGAVVKLSWSSASTPKQIIPKEALFPPADAIVKATVPTLADRLSDAQSGETVVLGPGRYDAGAGVALPAGVSLKGAGPHLTVIEGTVTMMGTSRAVVEQLAVTGGQVGIDTGSADAVLRNVLVAQNQGAGIVAGKEGSIEAVSLTVADNGSDGIRLLTPRAEVRGAVVIGNGGFGVSGPPGAAVRFSLLYANALGAVDGGVDALTASTDGDGIAFLDPASRDYRELAGSPTLDAGDPSDDYTGEPDPNGGRANQGAFANTAYALPSSASAPRSGGSSGGCGLLGLELLLLLAIRIGRRAHRAPAQDAERFEE